jgi:hypothetical protein
LVRTILRNNFAVNNLQINIKRKKHGKRN